MKTKILFLLFLIPALLWCQENIISNIVSAAKAGGEKFPFYNNMFQKENTKDFVDGTLFIDSTKVNVFSFDFNLDSLNISNLSLEIALADENVTLELLKVPDSFYDYEVVTDKGIRYSGHNSTGKHFRGIIKGDNNSLVAISFFENQIMGIIAKDDGNYNIGNIENYTNKVIVYNEHNLKEKNDFECGTEDPDVNQMSGIQENIETGEKCVEMYFETEYKFFQHFGSAIAVENFVTATFNQVSLIYLNETIHTKISEINIWTEDDPYKDLPNKTQVLGKFRSRIDSLSFNGDLAQVLINRSIGGGLASTNNLCSIYKRSRASVAGNLTFSIKNFPIYSWNVMVITHEFGHTIGSPHTHTCAWNGNNTAIDGCGYQAGYGGCNGPIPPNGGTIMSYCHLNPVGINFNNGFGPQPGNLIRNRVSNATCLGECICLSIKQITAPVLTSETFQTHNLIIATSEIADDITVAYKSTQVLLRPGFQVRGTASGSFLATVDPCID